MPAGLGSSLQRCDIDTSGSSKSEEGEGECGPQNTDDETVPAPVKRPAAKQSKKPRKAKNDDDDLTHLGSKGNRDDEDDNEDEPAPPKGRSRKKRDTTEKDEKKTKKRRKEKDTKSKGKRTKSGKKRGTMDEDSSSAHESVSDSEGKVAQEQVTEEMLSEAMGRAQLAEHLAWNGNKVGA